MSKQAQKEEDQEAVQLVNWSAFRDANVLTPEEVKLMQDISSPDLSDDNALKTVAKTVFEVSLQILQSGFFLLNNPFSHASFRRTRKHIYPRCSRF